MHAQLLRQLPTGGVLWLRAGGKSLWPLLLDGDSLRVVRCAPAALREGDVAVVAFGDTLVAHLVVGVNPVRTASSVGVVDAPGEPLGVVTAFRRLGREVPWPRELGRALRHVPALAVRLKALPLARRLVRRLRDRR